MPMVKEKEATVSPVRDLFQPALYKRSQGRIARQVTFAALATALVLGVWRMSVVINAAPEIKYGIPGVLLLVGLWLCYRLVNLPRFADFLIGVEAEMNKVSWPTQSELFRSSIVVMFTIFSLAIILFAYDMFWRWLLRILGVVN